MVDIRTGASAYLKYEYETSYGTGGTPNKIFGLQDRLTNWSLTHNRIDMPQLNQVTIQKYAYGQQAGSLSVGCVLSNPWVFESIYGAAPAPPSPSSGVYTHTWGATQPKNPTSLVCEIGYDGSAADIVRTVRGCVVNSLGISTSIGETVGCTLDMSYGKEIAPSTSLGTAPSEPTEEFAYTFAHGKLTVGGNVLAQVQDVDMTFAQNVNLLYGVGSNHAVNSYRQVFDLTGSFKASLLNKNLLEGVLAQIGANTSTTYEETVGGSPELELVFQSTASATQNEIKITGTGLAPTSIDIAGIEPVEPIFETINWRIKSATVAAKTTQATAE